MPYVFSSYLMSTPNIMIHNLHKSLKECRKQLPCKDLDLVLLKDFLYWKSIKLIYQKIRIDGMYLRWQNRTQIVKNFLGSLQKLKLKKGINQIIEHWLLNAKLLKHQTHALLRIMTLIIQKTICIFQSTVTINVSFLLLLKLILLTH